MTPPPNHAPTLSRRAFGATVLAFAAIGGSQQVLLAIQEVDIPSLLKAASQRLATIESLHFKLDVEGQTYIDADGAIQLRAAEGDLARPDKVAVEFQVNLLGTATVSIKMITIGPDSWTTDLITGNWGDAPPEFGYNPSVLYDNQNGLGPVMGKLESAEYAGIEDIDGREAHRLTGTATAEIIAPLTAGTMTGDNVGIELWIDTETSDLLRVRVVEPESEDKDDPATWLMTLSAFNDPVTIEPPE